MQLRKRDRPGKRGWRVIKVISIVLACILTLSSISVISNVFTDQFSKKGPNVINKTDGTYSDELIVMPENRGYVLYSALSPLNHYFYSLDDSTPLIEAEHLIQRGPDNSVSKGYQILLGNYDRYGGGRDLEKYTHMKIEFDLFNYLQNESMSGILFLSGRDSYDNGNFVDATKINIDSIEGSSQFKITTRTGKEFIGENFKIEYLIEVDKNTPWNSRVQFFLNGEMVESLNVLITQSHLITKLCEIRLGNMTGFNSNSLGVSNLVVTAYD